VLSCMPVKAFWDISVTQKKCINTTAFFIANSAVHVILDIAILTLPVRKVWALKMSMQKKIMVSFMFLLGGFICVIGIIRLFFLATLKMNDATYSLVDTYIWSSIETNVGVICACLPTLRPLFMKLFPKGGFDNRAVTAPPLGYEYGTDSHRSPRIPRVPRHTGNFERLPDCRLGDMSPGNSKTEILITHEVRQEHQAGKLSLTPSEEMWR